MQIDQNFCMSQASFYSADCRIELEVTLNTMIKEFKRKAGLAKLAAEEWDDCREKKLNMGVRHDKTVPS